jgi:predicted esterase
MLLSKISIPGLFLSQVTEKLYIDKSKYDEYELLQEINDKKECTKLSPSFEKEKLNDNLKHYSFIINDISISKLYLYFNNDNLYSSIIIDNLTIDLTKNNDIITNIKEPTEEYNNINDKTDSIESTDKTTKENEKIKDSNEIDSTKEYDEIVTNDINNINIEEYDEFNYTYYNASYATLVPKKGYDHIYIHLGGIMEIAGFFSDFFKSNRTFIPKGTKIYYLSGKLRTTEYVKDNIKDNFGGSIFGKIFGDLFDEVVDVVGDIVDLPSWFNVDKDGNLICDNCNGDNFAEAKESLYFILDKIDQISKDENIGYDKIYLGGFSQGGIMTNYVLLNSRHRLGGYLAFSGYIFDHHFPPNSVEKNLNDEQKQILNSKKDYHILATHSFNDDSVTYSRVIEGYYTYFKDYTDFTLLSFGTLGHEFENQPTHPFVRKWLKESMGK